MEENDSRLVPLPMLTKANYQRWKFEVKAELESLDLMDIADGADTQPNGEAASKKWHKRDAKAKRIFSAGCQMCTPRFVPEILRM